MTLKARGKFELKKKTTSRWISETTGMKKLIQKDSGECEEEMDKKRTLEISTFKRQKRGAHESSCQIAGGEERGNRKCSTMYAGET